MQSWLVLAAAIVCEVGGTICMELSKSLTDRRWIAPMLALYLLALLGLAIALKTIDVGVAYAVWAGTGTLLIATIGVFAFGESMSWLRAVSMLMVIAGVAGLHLSSSSLAHH